MKAKRDDAAIRERLREVLGEKKSVYQLKLHKCAVMGDVKALTPHQRLFRKVNSLGTKRKAYVD